MIGDVVTKPDGGGGHSLANVHQLVRNVTFAAGRALGGETGARDSNMGYG